VVDVDLAKVNVEGSSPFARSTEANENGHLEKHLRWPFLVSAPLLVQTHGRVVGGACPR